MITWLLWLHALVIPVYAGVRGLAPSHVVLEAAVVPVAAIAASQAALSQRLRTLVASFGLLSCSAILVHLSGGVIEMHFHFFVMVAVVSLYQDWLPFLTAIGYVLVHHGALGALDPESVFNHPAAINHPWRWAGIHAFFIAGISAACLVNWRLNERQLEEVHLAEKRLRDETRVVERLNEVGSMLAAELDLDHVVQRVTDVATELTDAEFGAFFYNSTTEAGDGYLLYSLSGVPAEAFAGFEMPRATAMFGPTFRGEAVLRIDDVLADPRYGLSSPHHGMPAGHVAVRSYLAVPVVSLGEVVGGLFFGHGEPARFTDAHERAATGIAAHAAVAVQNARLYSNQRAAAETLQQSLLPDRLPVIPGVSLAARYLPGGPGLDVGGDWYDVFGLPDGSLGLVMGDVVGRGVAAASLMGQLRNALRAYALEGHPPATVVDLLNDLACGLGRGYVATLVFAALDAVSGQLRVVNAGHPPPLIIDGQERAIFFEGAAGVPLGVLPGYAYREATTPLRPGAGVVLYTDGLVESRHTPLDDGLERLRAAAEGADVDTDSLCERILQRGAEAGADDTAILIARRAPLSTRFEVEVPTDASSLHWLRGVLRQSLDETQATEEERFAILVAAGEACSKAILRAPTGHDTFRLAAELDGEDLRITITMPPGGGGDPMRLVDELMDEVTFTPGPGAGVLSMRRHLSGSPVNG
ncbi:MAG TPA: SpoIIE family protein phosphatase [Acidimicrobiales bacterium]|nr:SpoIIE family protein phosphatase [Acidimicrobiales bacterium]